MCQIDIPNSIGVSRIFHYGLAAMFAPVRARARRIGLFCLTAILLSVAAHEVQAQIEIGLKVSRRLYMAYEPIVATVSITNLTGRDIVLDDFEGRQWFGFQITTADHRPIPPRDPDYQLAPLNLPNGQTLKRSVNLVSLYPITDFGLYRIRANVFFAELNKYFSSVPTSVEISDGKLMWQQTVGIPDGQPGAGGYRVYKLLSFRQPKDNMLYVRVEDRDEGSIYGVYPLGHLIIGNDPQVQLDAGNGLHVLHLVGPKTFVYSRIGINAEWLGQMTYSTQKTRPQLRKLASGKVDVLGGQMDAPVAQAVDSSGEVQAPPKLSDRPPGMPGQ